MRDTSSYIVKIVSRGETTARELEPDEPCDVVFFSVDKSGKKTEVERKEFHNSYEASRFIWEQYCNWPYPSDY